MQQCCVPPLLVAELFHEMKWSLDTEHPVYRMWCLEQVSGDEPHCCLFSRFQGLGL